MSNTNPRKILAIDDNPTNLALLKVHLKQIGLVPLLANNALEGIEVAIKEQPDLILLDIMMPEIDGYETCRRLKSDHRTESIPIIFISAKGRSEDKIMGLELGAIDYVTKPFDPGELKARIGIILQMISLQEKLVAQANTDELTGLANRRRFLEILERELLQANVKGTPLSVVMMDIDHFKQINDTYGHLSGDMILKQLAEVLQENIYPLDIAARYGGEEFILIMPETNMDKAVHAANRIREMIQKNSWKVSLEQFTVTISMGIAVTDADTPLDSYEIVKRADTALYSAKRRGRNCVVPWDDVIPEEEVAVEENNDIRSLQSKLSSLVTQMRTQAMGAITSLSQALSAKDPFLIHHAQNVRTYVQAIIREMNLSEELSDQILNAAILHDIGKIGIPNKLLTKQTELSDQELITYRQHPLTSVQIIAPLGIFQQELQIIKHHHENYDGTGYPDGLAEKRIPFGARILAVANTYDAMTSDRQHRTAKTGVEALLEISKCSGTMFDPEIVDTFLKLAKKHTNDWPLAQCEEFVLTS